MALDMLGAVSNYRIAHRPNDILKLRIGIHTGEFLFDLTAFLQQ